MGSLEDNTVYMTLNTRGVPGTFHWGIFITTSAPRGHYYHATTKFGGGWQLETKASPDPMRSYTLVLLVQISGVQSWNGISEVMGSVPADGTPSQQNGEVFSCRTWVKDTLVALHDQGLVKMREDIDAIERNARLQGARLEPEVERGGPPTVV